MDFNFKIHSILKNEVNIQMWRDINPISTQVNLKSSHAVIKMYKITKDSLRFAILIMLSFLALLFVFSFPSQAHEVWLLTPAQVAALVTHPQPELFRYFNSVTMAIALSAGLVVAIATYADKFLVAQEVRFLNVLPQKPEQMMLTVCRLGLGVLCISASLGLAPRYGTSYFVAPTLFVSDLEISRLGSFLTRVFQYAQLGVGTLLITNIMARFAGMGIFILVGAGYFYFGKDMTPYAGHLLAPAFLVVMLGGWFWPRRFENMAARSEKATRGVLTVFRVLIGLNFMYLAIAFKIQQPNLLIAIIEGAGVPTFGFSVVLLSYIMGIVEFTIGLLIVVGVVVRPATLAAVGAMVFFMIVLKEPPHVHANIIGSTLALLIMGSGGETVQFHARLVKSARNQARQAMTHYAQVWARRSSNVLSQKINYAGLAAACVVALGGLWTPVFAARADLPSTLFTLLPNAQPTPELEFKAERDSLGHVIVNIDAKNYTFAALCARTDVQSPIASGHAHVYVNDRKLGMISIPQIDLGALKTGTYRVTVSLNDERHRFLVSKGKALMVTRLLDVDTKGHIHIRKVDM
jgi:uncharacterized membrane protein YphA (DoxX/SURF4 family)